MDYQLQSRSLGEGVNFHWVQDPKFKHNRMSVNLVLPLRRETVTQYALLPFLLRKGYKGCPDFTQLNAKLCQLYGAGLSGDVSKYGAEQVLNLSVIGLDDRFTIDNEEIASQCAQLLAGIVCQPNLVDGTFPETDVALEKQFLKDTIEAELNDKRSYALSKCRSIMCEGEPTAIKKYGYVEDLAAITPAAAAAAYAQAFDQAVVEIVFIGCGSPETAMEVFAQAFANCDRHPQPRQQNSRKLVSDQVREEVEHMELSQAKMVLGFRAGALEDARSQAAARLMTALYGGTPFSKLFIHVREKLSLCYYCAARFDRISGIMMVDCGIEGQNKEKAQAEILRQLELLAQGEFTDEDLANAKMTMRNSLRSVTDSLGSLEDWYLARVLGGDRYSPSEDAALLEDITREEIAAAASRMSLDTVYLLTGKEA